MTYIVSYVPLNIIRLVKVTDLCPIPEESRLWLDVLGGSAGIINSLAFFVSERTFPFICKDPDVLLDSNSNSLEHQDYEHQNGQVYLINTSDINIESGAGGKYLYEESTPSRYNEFYDDKSYLGGGQLHHVDNNAIENYGTL